MTLQLRFLCGILLALQVQAAAATITSTRSMLTAKTFLETHTNHSLVSDFVLNLYRNLAKGMPIDVASGRPRHWRDMQFVDTVRSFPSFDSFEGDPTDLLVYKFNVSLDSMSSMTEILRVAELRLVLPASWSRHVVQHLYVTACSASKEDGFTSSTSVVVSATGGSDSADGRVQVLDVTTVIGEWLQFVRQQRRDPVNATIEVILMAGGVNNRKIFNRSKFLVKRIRGIEDQERRRQAPVDAQAILVVYTEVGGFLDSGNAARRKRHTNHLDQDVERSNKMQEREVKMTGSANRSSNKLRSTSSKVIGQSIDRVEPSTGQCRRTDLDVDFAAIGWGEWVVYPTQFNAFQCSGRCSGYADSRSNPTNHAIVQSLVRLVGREAFPMACCAPTRLLPLSILYMEKGSVVIKHHEDMIVEECGCM